MNQKASHHTAVIMRLVFQHGRTCGSCIHASTANVPWCHKHGEHPNNRVQRFTRTLACNDYRFGLPQNPGDWPELEEWIGDDGPSSHD